MNMCSCNCFQLKNKDSQQITALSTLLKIIAEENRLKLLCLLNQGEHCVCEILTHFELSQSLISHHLADLKEAGLIKDRKDGRKVFYSLTNQGKKATETVFSLKGDRL